MDKVIEAMAEAVHYWHVGSIEDWDNETYWKGPKKSEYFDAAKTLLNLRYDCKECGGDGSVNDIDDHPYPCSKCNGTGKGSRMLAMLDPDQEPPENPYPEPPYMMGLTQWDICQMVQQDMLKTDADGYAFRRVKVEEDNDET